MQLSKDTVDILKNFSAVNTNLVIKPGKSFSTVSPSKDFMAEYTGADDFTKKVCIFNLNEFLSVISAFGTPDIELHDNFAVISEGKQKVKYFYAAEHLLVSPQKTINMPPSDVDFKITGSQLQRIQKMSGILSVDDVSFIGDGKTIIARVGDPKNTTGNQFDVELDTPTDKSFSIHFKMEKISKLYSGEYDVSISSKKISKFNHCEKKLTVFIAVESDSQF